MSRWRGNGDELPEHLVGWLRDSSALRHDGAGLRRRLADDGYLFLRDVVPEAVTTAARLEVLERLHAVGEVAEPVAAGRWSGTSRRADQAPDLGAFWRSVCEGPALRQVSHGPALRAQLRELFGTEPLGQDFLYLRAGVAGTATDLHCDHPFFARRSEQVVTCWVPIAEAPIELGPLVVVEGSHRFADLVEAVRGLDVVARPEQRAALEDSMVGFAAARGARLLSADFRPGDLVVLGMLTFHASLDNHDPQQRIRLSFDVRYQPIGEPRDERFFGAPPVGITGKGYAELNGAKPLGVSWHQR